MKVVITRPLEKGKDFSEMLENAGFGTIIIPTLELVFKKAEINLEKYSWIVFTSPRGIEGFFKNLTSKDIEKVLTKKIGAIGIETAKEFEKIFKKPVYVIPDLYTAENLLEALEKQVKPGEGVLVPTTPSTRDVLKEGLNADLIFVYSSEEPENISKKLEELEKQVISENKNNKKVILTFTSGLTAKNFFKHCRPEFLELLKEQHVVSIGPITKKNVDSFGFDSLMPEKNYTVEGMLPVIKALNI
ncbi:uroporphyrinogen-III synthase [Methanococcus maripaludis C5]|uniref:Uroporphyrinogen-III synthase n=1 Tax=Methanococcus maripaludis (strain C5 / ATCC BAA-1333) TaxID=402880 RepID=A4FZA8_METM5|nr:uroporphyrinogen-III synthase [Methanococcus maripaludis]ABO35542.1 uroporphyrinogen-III synthase [Methanococcus maripaludis C5]